LKFNRGNLNLMASFFPMYSVVPFGHMNIRFIRHASNQEFRSEKANPNPVVVLFLHLKVGGWTWVWEMTKHLLENSKSDIEVRDISFKWRTKKVRNRKLANERLVGTFSVYHERFNFVQEEQLLFRTICMSVLCLSRILLRRGPVGPSFMFSKLPIGRILASNISAQVGRFHFNLKTIKKRHLAQMLLEFFNAFYKASRTLTSSTAPIDFIITSNGRDLMSSAIVLFARRNNLRVKLLELNPLNDTILLFEDSPHSVRESWQLLNSYYKLESDVRLIDNYFNERLGRRLSIPIYSPSNSKKSLLEKIRRQSNGKAIVSFFTSSEHEAPVLEEWTGPKAYFKDQFHAVSFLREICRQRQLKLVIRRHPNSVSAVSLQDPEEQAWSNFAIDGTVAYLSPYDEINSYDLIQISDYVLTWASTIALEAAYLGVPSRAVSSANWAFRKSMRLESPNEVQDFLTSPSLIPTKELAAYVNLQMRAGIPFGLFDFHESRSAMLSGLVIGESRHGTVQL